MMDSITVTHTHIHTPPLPVVEYDTVLCYRVSWTY